MHTLNKNYQKNMEEGGMNMFAYASMVLDRESGLFIMDNHDELNRLV
jgi:hypothetical protein